MIFNSNGEINIAVLSSAFATLKLGTGKGFGGYEGYDNFFFVS